MTVVIYSSKYGSTKRYAEQIAQALSADLLDERQLKPQDFDSYDTIVIGGRVVAGSIQGLRKLKLALSRLTDKRIFAFAVCIEPSSQALVDRLTKRNFSDTGCLVAPLSVLPGRINYPELKFFDRHIINMVAKMLQNQAAKNPDATNPLANIQGQDYNATDQAAIEPLVAAVLAGR